MAQLASPTMWTLTTTEGDLDLFRIVAGIGDYRAALARSAEFDIDGVRIRALALDAELRSLRSGDVGQ